MKRFVTFVEKVRKRCRHLKQTGNKFTVLQKPYLEQKEKIMEEVLTIDKIPKEDQKEYMQIIWEMWCKRGQLLKNVERCEQAQDE